MALKVAFLPIFTPFLIIMFICEHRYNSQNRPDARKGPSRAGLFPSLLRRYGGLGPFFRLFSASRTGRLRASPGVALPPSMLATRKRIGRLYDNHLLLAQHLDA